MNKVHEKILWDYRKDLIKKQERIDQVFGHPVLFYSKIIDIIGEILIDKKYLSDEEVSRRLVDVIFHIDQVHNLFREVFDVELMEFDKYFDVLIPIAEKLGKFEENLIGQYFPTTCIDMKLDMFLSKEEIAEYTPEVIFQNCKKGLFLKDIKKQMDEDIQKQVEKDFERHTRELVKKYIGKEVEVRFLKDDDESGISIGKKKVLIDEDEDPYIRFKKKNYYIIGATWGDSMHEIDYVVIKS